MNDFNKNIEKRISALSMHSPLTCSLYCPQALLVWSKHVAAHDLSFAKGLLHRLMGGLSPGGEKGSNITRNRRSVDTPPQNTEEDL